MTSLPDDHRYLTSSEFTVGLAVRLETQSQTVVFQHNTEVQLREEYFSCPRRSKRVSVTTTMARLFRAMCTLAVLCLVTAQNDEDLESVLSQVFPETGENTTTKDPPSAGQGGGITGNCTCVPYYLCKPPPTFRDIYRFANSDACEHPLDVCCASEDITELKPQSDRLPQKYPETGENTTTQNNEDLESLISQLYSERGENTTTKNPPSAGQGGDITGNCTCVPYYLCKLNPTIRANTDTCENYIDVCCASGDIVELKEQTDRPPQK